MVDLSVGRRNWHALVLFLLMLGYGVWAMAWILRDPVVGLDGQRYFVLFDDAMISMRYGWNLAHGDGPTWNPGERVEGYTSLLMVLVMALVSSVADRRMAPLLVQLLAIPSVLLTAFCVSRLAWRLCADCGRERRRWVSVLSAFATLSYFPLSFWTLEGMETGLATLLLAAGVLFALRRDGLHAGLALGVGTWARPELAWAGVCILGSAAAVDARGRGSFGWLIRNAALLLVFPASQTLWRRWYYDAWVPNTYTLKVTGMPLGLRLANGWAYVWPTLLVLAGVLLLLALAACDRRVRRFWPATAAVVAVIASTVALGGDVFPLERFLAPAVPLAMASAIAFAATITSDRPRTRAGLAALAIAGSWLALEAGHLRYFTFREQVSFGRSPRALVNTALAIRQLTTPKALIGVFWAGTIPYYADRRAVDFLGKCDPAIARLPPDLESAVGGRPLRTAPGHNKYDLEYSIRRLRPDYVQGFRWARSDLRPLGLADYVRVGFDVPGGSIDVRRGSPNVIWSRIRPQSPSAPRP
jgi:hypothetical protein